MGSMGLTPGSKRSSYGGTSAKSKKT